MAAKSIDVTASPKPRVIQAACKLVRERFAVLGVGGDKAVRAALRIPISVQCWQADDVAGLGTHEEALDFFDASINRVAAWVIGARGPQEPPERPARAVARDPCARV